MVGLGPHSKGKLDRASIAGYSSCVILNRLSRRMREEYGGPMARSLAPSQARLVRRQAAAPPGSAKSERTES